MYLDISILAQAIQGDDASRLFIIIDFLINRKSTGKITELAFTPCKKIAFFSNKSENCF